MDDTMLKQYIRQKIDTWETDDVQFSWQDGDFTSDRLVFLKRVIALQQRFAQGKNIINTFLINGITLDDGWCEFFKKNHFLLCISVDGDSQLCNTFSKTMSESPVTNRIEANVRLLQKHDITFNTLTVINNINSQQPLRVYYYLKNLGSRHMLFIPLLKSPEQDGVDAQSLAPSALGIFLKTIFYTWIRMDIGTIKIPIFEHAFAAWCGLSVPTCVYASCDDSNQPVAATMQESTVNHRVEQFTTPLAEECTRCKMEFACHGGCAKDRIALSQSGVPRLNYFCESYQAFFTYVEPYMLMMRALWEQHYAPSDIRKYLA
ncbi:radical SAM protein [Enterobacter sp. ECC-019]|uniref:radical SAM protein n=1 Tax=Enterobacter sp. ECC-019 TaxID=3116478 RepID=UPI003754490E